MKKESYEGGTVERPRTLAPLLGLAGSVACIALIAIYMSHQGSESLWAAFRTANPLLLISTLPLVLINMILRSARWRALLDAPGDTTMSKTFSALMIGYLANNVLPVRLGDLVRVVVLAHSSKLSRSRILSTVLLERLLDIAMVVMLLASITLLGPLPPWMRSAALTTSAVAVAGFAVVGLVVIAGAGVKEITSRVLPFLPQAIIARLSIWISEFSFGVRQFRRPSIAIAFFGGTLAIWASELLIVTLVAKAFDISLKPLDAGLLMLFSLFSSFIPALPGQVGTFEAAMLLGLEFLRLGSSSALAFALCLHTLLLGCTSMLGLFCLLQSGLPLLPWKFIERIRSEN